MKVCPICGAMARGFYCSIQCLGESKRKHSPAVIDAIRGHLDDGKSYAQAARDVGLSKNQVVGIAHRNDFPARPSPIKRRPE